MRAIASRVTTKDATLFLQAVDLDNTGYDVAEPRTITALVAYIPSCESEDRCMGSVALLTPPPQTCRPID